MLREVKHICGHSEAHDLRGNRTRVANSRRFFEARLCTECWKLEQAEKQKVAAIANAEDGMPALKGTPLDIIKADLVRYDFFQFIRDHYKDFAERQGYTGAIDLLRHKQQATWWLLHQRDKYLHLFDLAIDHAIHAERLRELTPIIKQRIVDLHKVKLSGSVKQNQWAEQIRSRILEDIIGTELCIEQALEDREDWADLLFQLCKDLEPVPKQLEKMAAELALMDASNHWIEIREMTLAQLAEWMRRDKGLVRVLKLVQGRFFFILNM